MEEWRKSYKHINAYVYADNNNLGNEQEENPIRREKYG
jgi:hypothetical protein